jgi:light-regulated signal transduction histidine kinase (bacteriophytochrome)
MRNLQAALRNLPPAKYDHDWAPVHMLGSVQPYGVLLVPEAGSRRVLFASANAESMLGTPASDLLENSYLLLWENKRERAYVEEHITSETILFPNPVRVTLKGLESNAIFHAHANTHQIEIESVGEAASDYAEMAIKATAELFDPRSGFGACSPAIITRQNWFPSASGWSASRPP